MKLLKALRNSASRIADDLENSNLFEHKGNRGKFREAIIENFLRPYLPKCYGLGSGEVFSEDGQSSRQLDVIIFDAVFSNILFRDDRNSLFPCESVFGNIEVKSNIDTEGLEEDIDKIASLKRLPREPSDMMDILPFRRINPGKGLSYDEAKKNPYLGIIFAYDGLTADSVVSNLNDKVRDTSYQSTLPNFIFNKEREYIVMRVKSENGRVVPASPQEKYEAFASENLGQDILPMFFFTINICLNQIILRAPDFNKYWVKTFNSATQ